MRRSSAVGHAGGRRWGPYAELEPPKSLDASSSTPRDQANSRRRAFATTRSGLRIPVGPLNTNSVPPLVRGLSLQRGSGVIAEQRGNLVIGEASSA